MDALSRTEAIAVVESSNLEILLGNTNPPIVPESNFEATTAQPVKLRITLLLPTREEETFEIEEEPLLLQNA